MVVSNQIYAVQRQNMVKNARSVVIRDTRSEGIELSNAKMGLGKRLLISHA